VESFYLNIYFGMISAFCNTNCMQSNLVLLRGLRPGIFGFVASLKSYFRIQMKICHFLEINRKKKGLSFLLKIVLVFDFGMTLLE